MRGRSLVLKSVMDLNRDEHLWKVKMYTIPYTYEEKFSCSHDALNFTKPGGSFLTPKKRLKYVYMNRVCPIIVTDNTSHMSSDVLLLSGYSEITSIM